MRKMKSIKVFFLGNRLKDVYPYASRWEVVKYRSARALRALALFAVACAAIALAGFVGSRLFPVTVYERQEVLVDAMPSKIEKLKNEVVEQLMACESNGYTDEDAVIIMDANNKLSYGRLMFQRATVIHYYNLLYGVKLTGKEAVLLALDTERAKELAVRIMFETPNMAGKDWVNCDRKLGLDQQIKLIKKLY